MAQPYYREESLLKMNVKLKFYGVKDDATGEIVFTFLTQNELTMKRVVKSALLGKEPNVFTKDLKDKKIYDLGDLDVITGKIENNDVVYVVSVSEIRLELIREIKIAKQEAGEKEPDASEVADDE